MWRRLRNLHNRITIARTVLKSNAFEFIDYEDGTPVLYEYNPDEIPAFESMGKMLRVQIPVWYHKLNTEEQDA